MNMKGTKILVSLIMMTAIICLVFGQGASYAYQDLQANPFWVGLSEYRKNYTPNTAYGIGDMSQLGGRVVWKFDSFDSQTGTSSTNKTLYCVKGGFGHTWNDPTSGDTNAKVAYKLGYDLKTEKSEIEGLSTRAAEYSNIAGENYIKILWVTDNLYIPGESTEADKIALLKAAGIDTESEEYIAHPITDDDIEAVQQMALWYFTNTDIHRQDNLDAINIKNEQTINQDYQTLSTFKQNVNGEGAIRLDQMNALYSYLLNSATTNADKYKETTESGVTTTDLEKAPVTITTTTLGLTESGDNYLVGPINLTKNNDLPYSLDITVKNGSGSTISTATFVNASGTEVDKDKVTEFYVKVPKSSGNKINLNINIKYKTSNTTLWVPGTANNEQPIIEPVKVPHEIPVELSTNPSSPFDLALRKFITAVSSDATFEDGEYLTSTGNATGTYTRQPNVDVTALKNGTATTATYSHTKEPLKVKNGDYIEYTLRVYNEGEADGYAEEITDYILNNVGLEYVSGHATNTTYGWKMYKEDGTETTNVSEAVKVKTNYLSSSNTSNKLSAFDPATGTTLDSKDLKIVFKVVKPANFNYSTKLVNIAEISDDKDENGNDVTDRDSTPGSDKENYPNNPEYKYNTEHHEDDIDYEPVELYKFDLSLRKFITAISSDTTIDESDYLTGTSSREPVVTYENGKLVYTHPKNPVPVKSGDYVLYTIRVYNEGEIDGYASLIRDMIPEGLAYDSTVISHEINSNNMWTVQTDGSITTDILAKGNGEEESTVPGDAKYTANLLKAFDKDSAISNTAGSLNPDYRDVQVLLHVTESDDSDRVLDNRAQIADDSDENGNSVDDIDSTPDEWNDGEDDQDHDPVKLQAFDLALRKFITQVGELAVTDRTPDVKAEGLNEGTDTTAKYNHTKTPLEVTKGSNIVYTLRVYNEGDVDGYASQITDHLPEYLEFVPASESEINTEYGWTEVEGSNGRVYVTNYLAPKDGETAANTKKIKAREGTLLHYQEVKIECKLKDNAPLEYNITNIAEISEYRDENKTVVNPDRDSTSNNVNVPEDADLPNYNGGTDTDTTDNYIPGQQDDDDFEKVIIRKKVDLALTKFITAISADATIEDGEYLTPNKNIGSETNPYDRQTAVNTNPLKDGDTDAIYVQVKTPLTVGNNSYVLYNIRVYNEGEVDVYAGEVTDYLPEYLSFVPGEFNTSYGWNAEGQVVKTSYLSHTNGTDKMLKAFDSENDDGEGSGLDYRDLPILCQVNNTAPSGRKLINTAEITKYEDKDGNDLPKDIDSTPENKQTKNNEEREEDDDDYEVVLVKRVDLALTKFITAISADEKIEDGEYLTPNKNIGSETNPYDRQTAVNTNPLKEGEHDAIYTQVKDPLTVNRESYVLYNIRVYNEGSVDVYAGEVTDYLPENLDFVEGEFNSSYGWNAEGQVVKTTFLSSANGEDKMLKAFDSSSDDGAGSGLDYKDLPILCRVNSKTPSAKELINTAEITKYEDEDGNDLPKDVDSTPENKQTKNDKNREEDDDDYEVVVVEEFDLSLLKYVSKVIVTEDGKTKTTETHNTGNNATDIIPKVEIHKKKINSTTVKFVYTIRITNEGDIEGYAKEITDYVPQGLSFHSEDNSNWTVKSDGVIATRALENTLLKPGESADVEVTFRWINGANNLNLKRNTAEISEDYNDKKIPDRDSTPDNKKDGEDDIDIADVLLSIKTGRAASYVLLVGAVLVVLAGGVIVIKKYVM